MLSVLSHPKLFDSFVKPIPAVSIDTLRVIEKVYIHTDRNLYYPGNDIWFKAYLIDASDRLLSSNSNNLHVELISPFSKIIISRVIRLESGLGNGDFKLPDNIKSGKYRLRAYTNFMRNFGDQLFFQKEIVVINPTDTKDDIREEIKYVKNNIDIRFFPEGGSLVDNVSSVVAFKAVNAIGKGCDVSGYVYSSTGDLVTTFKSEHLGMGSFFLRPVSGLSYYAVVKDITGAEIKSEISKSFLTGVTLSASIDQNNRLLITTKTNTQTLPFILGRNLLLTFSARKVTLKTFSFKISSYNSSFTLPIDTLPDGIVMITLSVLEDLPLCERLIYIQRDNDFKVSMELNKSVYKKRDSVAIKISHSTDSDIPQVAFLSLSAVEKRFTDSSLEYPSTISSWFLLESDIRGNIEEPSYYFDSSNRNRAHNLDLLLLTQGWRDFEWKYNFGYYPPEGGFTVSGSLRKFDVSKPFEVSKVNIGIVENSHSLMTNMPVDSSGRFRLDGIDFTGEARLIVSATGRKGRPLGTIVLDSLKYKPEKVSENLLQQMVLQKENLTILKQKGLIKATFPKKFNFSDTISLGEISIIAPKLKDFQTIRIENSRMIYGKANVELIITPQFAGYENVFEVLSGRVAGVKVDKLNGKYNIRIRGINSINGGSMPLFLIDGMKQSYDAMIALPVGFIDRIDILKSAGETSIFGVQGANGVISVITRTGDRLLPNKSVNHTVNTIISGYDAPRIFYSPRHKLSTVSASEPDLRTTLFWEPNISIQSNEKLFLNYFNADNPSMIRVTGEGITTTGIPITFMTEYKVE